MLEFDQGLREKSEKFEKEKLALIEQNKQLRKEKDQVCAHLLQGLHLCTGFSLEIYFQVVQTHLLKAQREPVHLQYLLSLFYSRCCPIFQMS